MIISALSPLLPISSTLSLLPTTSPWSSETSLPSSRKYTGKEEGNLELSTACRWDVLLEPDCLTQQEMELAFINSHSLLFYTIELSLLLSHNCTNTFLASNILSMISILKPFNGSIIPPNLVWKKGKEHVVDQGHTEERQVVEEEEDKSILNCVKNPITTCFGILRISLNLLTNSLLLNSGALIPPTPILSSLTLWAISF